MYRVSFYASGPLFHSPMSQQKNFVSFSWLIWIPGGAKQQKQKKMQQSVLDNEYPISLTWNSNSSISGFRNVTTGSRTSSSSLWKVLLNSWYLFCTPKVNFYSPSMTSLSSWRTFFDTFLINYFSGICSISPSFS